jgi:kinesin family member 21
MQETIDVLTAKNSQLLAEREVGDWIRGGSGDAEANNDFTAMVQKYITEIEELRAKLCESENMAEQLRKESAKAKRLSQTFSPAGKVASAWNPPVGGVVDLNMEDDSGYSVQV